MNKTTLIKIIEDIDMKDIVDIKIKYVIEKGYGYSNDEYEILEIKK